MEGILKDKINAFVKVEFTFIAYTQKKIKQILVHH